MRLSLPLKITIIASLISGLGILGIAYTSYRYADNLLQKQAMNHLGNDVQHEKMRLVTALGSRWHPQWS